VGILSHEAAGPLEYIFPPIYSQFLNLFTGL